MASLQALKKINNESQHNYIISSSDYNLEIISVRSLSAVVVKNINPNTKLYTGLYLKKISIYDCNNLIYSHSGIITKTLSENTFEIGLTNDIFFDFFSEINKDFDEVKVFKSHNSGEELRQSNRVSLRVEDAIFIKILYENLTISATIFDISSFGLNFISNVYISNESIVNFELIIQGKEIKGSGVISWTNKFKDNFKIGIKFLNFNNTAHINLQNHVLLKEKYTLKGIFTRSNYYLETANFDLLSMSKKSLILKIKCTDQFILPTMKLDLNFFLSISTNQIVNVDVVKVEEGLEKSLIVSCNILNFPEEISKGLTNYFLNYLEISPTELRDAGFDVKDIAKSFSFRYVESHAEYLEVLKLRYISYLSAKKIDDTKSVKDMITALDSKSRIIIAKHHGKIIATVAVAFPDSEDLILDTEKPLKGGYPKSFPKKTNLIEISRLCTHPDYRKGDLLHRVFEHIYKLFLISGRGFMISSCDENLWPLYKKLGFKKSGLSYNHLALSGLLHYIIIVPLDVGLKAKNVNLLAWSYMYNSMFSFLEKKGLVKVNFITRSKIYLSDLGLSILKNLRVIK